MIRLIACMAFILAASAAWAQNATTPGTNAIACAYNAVAPTVSSGYFSLVQCDSHGNIITSNAPNLATYSAGFDVTAVGTTSTTDIVQLCGSSTKTIRLRQIITSGAAASASQIDLQFQKKSTPDTGGTPTSITKVPNDSANSAATATLVTFASAPTLGTLVGAVRDVQIGLAANGMPTYPPLTFGDNANQPITLRGTSECLVVYLDTGALPNGGRISFTFEWVEE